LKYEFVVKPGADPAQIQLAYRGVTGVQRNDAGQLEVSTSTGGFREDKPYTYQEVDGQRVEVASSYVVKSHTYGFRVDDYDRSQPLVIDPVVLIYCGYIGGAGEFNTGGGEDELGTGIAVDSAGNAYVTGITNSAPASFPEKVGPDLTWNNDVDAFVAKVKADGTGFEYSGYVGFPVTGGPDLTFNGGLADAFIARLNASDTSFVYCSYIGGDGYDKGYGVAVDADGDAYVTGSVASNAGFPLTVGPDITPNFGNSDAFVAKVSIVTTPPSANLVVTGHAVELLKPRKLVSVVTVRNYGPNGTDAVLNYSYNLAPPLSVVSVSGVTSSGKLVPVPYTITPKGIQVELGHLYPFNLGGTIVNTNTRTVRIEATVPEGQITCKAVVGSQPSISDPNRNNNTSSIAKSVP
jgi:hypothetical protein